MSMLAIVAYHCMCYNAGIWVRYSCSNVNENINTVAKLLVTTALPMFFFISGYVYALNFKERNKYGEFLSFVKNKCIRLIIPTISFTIVYLIFFPREYTIVEMLSGVGHLWFLPTLFVCFLLIYPFSNILLKEVNSVTGGGENMLVIMILTWLSANSNKFVEFPVAYAVSFYLVYMVIGMMSYHFIKSFFYIKASKVILSIMAMAFVLAHFIISKYDGNMFSIADILCLSILCVLLLGFLTLKHPKENSSLRFLDKHSMRIYLIHQPVIMAVYEYSDFEEKYLSPHPYWYIPTLFILVCAVSMILSVVCEKLRMYPII